MNMYGSHSSMFPYVPKNTHRFVVRAEQKIDSDSGTVIKVISFMTVSETKHLSRNVYRPVQHGVVFNNTSHVC